MAAYTGNTGKVYSLASEFFAKGGEGEIYEIIGMNSYVAKIYYEKYQTSLREEKILTMIKKPPASNVINQFTWPIEVLYENNKFVGYIMPRLRNTYKLNKMYEYPRPPDKPWNLYIVIAKNLSAAINGVHISGHVCGDLNPNNICVNPLNGIITLVDTDSYHIYDDDTKTIYRCVVAMEAFIPKELQNKNLTSAALPTFTKETDLFTLAILIFSLLMNGCHPFACSNTLVSGSVNLPSHNIIEGLFPFMTKNNSITIPRYAPSINILGRKIKSLFKRAFVTGYKRPKKRPTAEEWYFALADLEKSLVNCELDPSHTYYKKLAECPWCEINANMKILTSMTFTQPAKAIPIKKSNLIHDHHSIFKLLDISVFESSHKAISMVKFHNYAVEFVYKKLRCLYIQLNFTHNLHNTVNVDINYNIIDESGNIVADESPQVSIDVTTSNYTIAIEYDKFTVGKYQIQVNIDKSNIVNKDIEIVKRRKISVFPIKHKISFISSVILWIWSMILVSVTGIAGVVTIIPLCFDFIQSDMKFKVIAKIVSFLMCVMISLYGVIR